MNDYGILIAAVLGVFLYALLARRLMIAARPIRQEMLELGEKLMGQNSLNDDQKDIIAFYLDRPLKSQDAWGVAILAIPAAIKTLASRSDSENFNRLPVAVKNDLNRFAALSIMTRLTNSPLALAITGVEMIGILLTSVSLSMLSRNLVKMITYTPHSGHASEAMSTKH